MSVAGTSKSRSSGKPAGRLLWIDCARGGAILMMALYHLVYDLDTFGGYALDSTSGFWARFADATAGTFLLLVGVSLTLSLARAGERDGLFGKYLRRGAGIFGYGMLITLFFGVFGLGAVVFGILHLIGVSIILAYPFLRLGWTNVALGIGVIAAGVALRAAGVSFGGALPAQVALAPFGILPESLTMPDYRPLLPGFGVVLLGIAAGNLLRGRLPKFEPPATAARGAIPLAFLGRHSLFVYLVHQPLIILALAAAGVIRLGLF